MTHLDANAPDTPEYLVNADGYLTGTVSGRYACAHCDEAFGRKKVAKADDGMVVHRRCLEGYDNMRSAKRHVERREAEEAELAEKRARLAANIERRGTDMSAFASFDNPEIRSLDGEDYAEWCFFLEAVTTLERAEKRLAEWGERLAGNPENAFSWSMEAFDAAADKSVFGQVAYYFERGLSVEEIKELADREVYRGARSPARSTSPVSNLMEQEVVAAYARVTGRPY